MSPPQLVSLITPTYNQARFVAETIDSVLAQDYPNIEYIVLDDGSTDDTPAVLSSYADRLRTVRHDNMGQARTLNKGWAMARGRYLGYLSSDDLLLSNALTRLVAVLDANPDIVCVFPDSDIIDGRSRVIRRSVCRPFDLETVIVSQECPIGPGALFRREAFEATGGWRPDMRLGPDREFWIRLAAQGQIRFVRESLARYRTHPEATSFTAATEEVSREFVRVLDDYFGRAPVPPALQRRRDEAYANAILLLARNALWRGECGVAMCHYREACVLHPPFRSLRTRVRLLRQGASKPAKVIHAWLTKSR